MGLRLSQEKTVITHIDEGVDFLGWHIQRHKKRGTAKQYVYTYPAKKALRTVMGKVKTLCGQNMNIPLAALLHRLNQMLRGWTAYFKYGSSSNTFGYLRIYLWERVIKWLGRKYRQATWRQLRRRFGSDGDGPTTGMWCCSTRPRCTPSATDTGEHESRRRGRRNWVKQGNPRGLWRARCIERCPPGSGGGSRRRTGREAGTAPRSDLTRRTFSRRCR